MDFEICVQRNRFLFHVKFEIQRNIHEDFYASPQKLELNNNGYRVRYRIQLKIANIKIF